MQIAKITNQITELFTFDLTVFAKVLFIYNFACN